MYVSPCFTCLQISLTDLPGPCLGLCVGVACFVVLGGFVVGFFLLGKFDLNHMLIPVVDRPCLALVRQCRKKKSLACVWVLLVLLFVGGFVVGFFLLGKFDLNHMLIPVVDRPCLALVRQCRKKM